MKKIVALLSLLTLPLLPLHAEEEHPVLVLGGGIGGLTSAVYLARAGVPPVIFTGPVLGGAITQSHMVENWTGEIAISGVALSDKVEKQAEKNGVDLRAETVVAVDFSKRPYLVTTRPATGEGSEKQYKTNACIIAMGATSNTLQIPGEEKYWANGVYTCAVCDGGLYKNRVVGIVGGGDAALIEAQYLANLAAKVHIFVRKADFRTVERQRMQQILSHPNIQVHYETTVQEIQGDGHQVTQLLLHSKQGSKTLAVDALFLAIGAQPNTQLFKGQLELDPQGYIVLKNNQETSREGVYAVGDVADPLFKQAICAAGDGAKAALQAQQFLATQMPSPVSQLPVKELAPLPREVIVIHSVAELEEVLSRGQGPVFVDFYADYCGPCRTFAPLYAAWAKKFGDRVTFLKVDATACRDLCDKFQIRALPTLLIFDEKGAVVHRAKGLGEVGAIEKRLERGEL